MSRLAITGPNDESKICEVRADSIVIGRTDESDIAVDWEPALSRRHATFAAEKQAIRITSLETARNSFFLDGNPIRDALLRPGDSVVIGKTVFSALGETNTPPAAEIVFEPIVPGGPVDRRLSVLAKLPELFEDMPVGRERDERLASLLLIGVPAAETTAVVELTDDDAPVAAWDRRHETSGPPNPSTRLVRDAVAKRKSLLHVWPRTSEESSDYTQAADADWAVCTPFEFDDCPRALYVSGRSGTSSESLAESLRTDVQFVDVLAQLLGAVRQGQRLEGRLSVLRQFFSPPVLATLDKGNESLLEPRECELTVLFADLRGFSGGVERVKSGELLAELDRVRSALSVMTQAVLDHGGVTGEFLGDAVLGFWGWPLESDDAANACRAALAIRESFTTRGESVGLGLVRGRAVAGRIVTGDRVSVNAFGPAVNLASRLQMMTKQLRVPVVVDPTVRQAAEASLKDDEALFRTLATVMPYGLENPLTVSELIPPSGLTAEQIASYEAGIEAFTAGDWTTAYSRLHAMPADDRAADFPMAMLTQHDRKSPDDWDGIVRLAKE